MVDEEWGDGRLAIVGAGVMGTALATLAVGRGLPVLLTDVSKEQLERARGAVRQQLRHARLLGKLPKGPDGELITDTTVAGLESAAAVIEAVTETTEAKTEALAAISAAVRPGTLIASNTSAVPVDELAGYTQRPEDVVGTHFMNPPYLIRAVEVIRGPRTGDAAMATLDRLLTALDREAIVVGDGPGFVSNRILMRVINDAARLVAEGRASAESVDRVFTGCFGHRTGPLATADLIGLDNIVDTLKVLHDRTGDDGYRACDLLLEKVRDGDFGHKTGNGFYSYGGTRA
ncbi:3-hydroxyacyl-CoA dehydrogenase [Streptomyces rimosus subsp. rimosus]|uniref:3-hydroxyacyl-CoA dehydrogenase family protein n=2 Tax=Streptomyces rimosus subsp. rimosus TaxID=132474 RepID=A0A8A1V5A3_STRR1|nr:3-hydroxyacyl-CoA dehydrogenase family protein [Streptomyces rimosus]KOG67591.1 3-hydroxyacyl-CoA dehydrogenase [Kitasatospora aureofaciens]KOT47251.1 3-hydroxyacyl-CoA dehydrogenase [Streptomyces sp. NRRL WC-3701]MYT45406.1 3-hydroxyacyl-CoA dehydrogenase family protein [Streptomyces sp. SID5471]QGY71426.1 3-hydroxyacyl-CoA dehydrogenase family protein [Streptomyces rimosus R6-500]KEF21394.1 3-hydroxyacyl-CoA dehydrogenase [Streptomyces rimosus]